MNSNNLSQFSLKQIAKKLNSINISIISVHERPFPKPKEQLLSFYTFFSHLVRIKDNGYFNRARLVTSLINFSFIRSIVAHTYSREGGKAYDQVSLFLCDLFRWLEGFNSMKDFCKILHDPVKGSQYRLYAGISETNIPSEAAFSLFRTHIFFPTMSFHLKSISAILNFFPITQNSLIPKIKRLNSLD